MAQPPDFLNTWSAQPEPQRLLFVFAGVELPDDATPAQRERFAAGQGGALVPMMCVDKRPEEIASFQTLADESSQFGHDWAMVFVAAMSGTLDKAPTLIAAGADLLAVISDLFNAPDISEEAEAPLQRMVDSIKQGAHSAFIPFNRQGEPVRFG